MKKIKTPTTVTTAILTLITIFFWAGFEIYRAITAKPIPVVPPEIINPVDPALDTKTLEGLSQRLFFSEETINNTITSKLPSPTPGVSAPPIATPPATQSATPTTLPVPSATP